MWTLGALVNSSIPFLQSCQLISGKGDRTSGFFSSRKPCLTYLSDDSAAQFRAFALHKSRKESFSPGTRKHSDISPNGFEDSEDNHQKGNESSCNTFEELRDNLTSSPVDATRDAVLKACTITSGALLGLGLLVREASHVASVEGWPILDASSQISFGFEMQHIQLTIGIVVLISSCRYILLKIWPEFLESSEAANQQVLGTLQPLDYLVVAILPGISEELLFRGALLPLLGLNWKSALIVGAIFGGLHFGGGRRYSFVIWASFVGFAYGMAAVKSSSIIVPIASHALNNLISGLLWRYRSSSQKIGE